MHFKKKNPTALDSKLLCARWKKESSPRISHLRSKEVLNSRAVFASGVKVAGDEHLDMLGGPEWGQREASPPRDPLPSFGFTQEQVACVCEVSDPIYDFFFN